MREWGFGDFSQFLDARMRVVGIRNDAELSRLSGVKQTQISNWRRGLARPTLDSLDKIAPALKVASRALYERAGYLTEPDQADDDLPDEFVELIATYRDARLTEEDRTTLRRSVEMFLAGFLAGLTKREQAATPAKRARRGRSAA